MDVEMCIREKVPLRSRNSTGVWVSMPGKGTLRKNPEHVGVSIGYACQCVFLVCQCVPMCVKVWVNGCMHVSVCMSRNV